MWNRPSASSRSRARFGVVVLAAALVAASVALPAPSEAAALARPWQLIQAVDFGPDGGSATSVSCATDSWCVAVGVQFPADNSIHSVLQHWDGFKWSPMAAPVSNDPTRELVSVSCPSVSFCAAVGFKQTIAGGVVGGIVGFVLLYDGVQWSEAHFAADPNDAFRAVSCATASFCVILGTGPNPLLYRFDGAALSDIAVPPPAVGATTTLSAVTCPTATLCAAVGSFRKSGTTADKPYAIHWNGTSWKNRNAAVPPSGTGQFRSVSCPDAVTCTAVGDTTAVRQGAATLIETSVGAAYTIAPTTETGSGTRLDGVSCASAKLCVAVGTWQAATLTLEWDGSTWTEAPSGTHVDVTGTAPPAVLSSVSCVVSGACFAAGQTATSPFFLANAVTTVRTVTVAYPASEAVRLSKNAIYFGLTPEIAQKQAVYVVAYLIGLSPGPPDPQTVPVPATPSKVISYWYESEYSVLDAVKSRFVVNDADATRFSVALVGYLLSLGGH